MFSARFGSGRTGSCRALGGGREVRERLAVIPGQKAFGMSRDFGGVTEQFAQVIERVDLVQFAGVDQAHKHVADASAVRGFVEQRILPMYDRLLQRPLANIVVQRRAGLTQKQRQLLPVLEQIIHRPAQ